MPEAFIKLSELSPITAEETPDSGLIEVSAMKDGAGLLKSWNMSLSELREKIAGGQVDSFYEHVQGASSNTWAITHNLNKKPSVLVIDSGGSQVEGDVSFDSLNQLTISFSGAFSGVAYLN